MRSHCHRRRGAPRPLKTNAGILYPAQGLRDLKQLVHPRPVLLGDETVKFLADQFFRIASNERAKRSRSKCDRVVGPQLHQGIRPAKRKRDIMVAFGLQILIFQLGHAAQLFPRFRRPRIGRYLCHYALHISLWLTLRISAFMKQPRKNALTIASLYHQKPIVLNFRFCTIALMTELLFLKLRTLHE